MVLCSAVESRPYLFLLALPSGVLAVGKLMRLFGSAQAFSDLPALTSLLLTGSQAVLVPGFSNPLLFTFRTFLYHSCLLAHFILPTSVFFIKEIVVNEGRFGKMDCSGLSFSESGFSGIWEADGEFF